MKNGKLQFIKINVFYIICLTHDREKIETKKEIVFICARKKLL